MYAPPEYFDDEEGEDDYEGFSFGEPSTSKVSRF